MDLPNVYCESGWCLQSRIVEFAKVLPKHKIIFGTDTRNEPGMWLRLLEVLCTNPTGHEPRRNVRGLPGQQHRPNDRHRTHIAPRTFEEAEQMLGHKAERQPVIELY
jgi:predicted TIM-barrel fold metal-dependent hydrolase